MNGVAFNLEAPRLVLRCSSTKENSDLGRIRDINLCADKAGIEVAVHVRAAVVNGTPGADARRP